MESYARPGVSLGSNRCCWPPVTQQPSTHMLRGKCHYHLQPRSEAPPPSEVLTRPLEGRILIHMSTLMTSEL